MARYVQQPDEGLPSARANAIHHFVKTFVDADPALLDIAINLWLIALEAIDSFPIIKDVNYSTILTGSPMAHVEYSVNIHYVLVE